MDIAEVSKASGLAPSTLRYYEQKGLITPTGRNGLRRQYASSVVLRLSLITLASKAGFSLSETKAFFSEDELVIDRDKLRKKADELDLKIQQLTQMRDGLRHTAACKAPSHLECPTFLRLTRLAQKLPDIK